MSLGIASSHQIVGTDDRRVQTGARDGLSVAAKPVRAGAFIDLAVGRLVSTASYEMNTKVLATAEANGRIALRRKLG